VDLEALVAQAVTARVDLEPPRPVLHLQEARLAEVAHRHHASRDRQRPRSGQLGLAQGGETRMHLGRRMVRTEVVRVRVDPPLPKRLELFPPDHDLLVVFGHAAEVSEAECVYWLPGGGSNNMIWGARPVLGRCAPCALPMPQTPSASSSAPALGLPGAPSS